jgi:outer membrane protein assembly factor BamB
MEEAAGAAEGAACPHLDEEPPVPTRSYRPSLHAMHLRRGSAALALVAAIASAWAPAPARADSGLLLYATEGNRLRRFDVDTIRTGPLVQQIFIERAGLDPVRGRDVNGMMCRFADGSGRFLAGEDTGQPTPPAGFGIFSAEGTQVGKLSPSYTSSFGEPYGCAFDAQGRLFTTDVGDEGFGGGNGQLVVWFRPYEGYPGPPGAYPNTNALSTSYCKLATNIPVALGVAVDESGNLYVASSASGRVLRFSGAIPTAPDAAGGCGSTDATGAPLIDVPLVRQTFVQHASIPTPSGIARAANGNWYVSSVLSGTISEFGPTGSFVRRVLELPPGEDPTTLPHTTGHPLSLAVDPQNGDLYYADQNLVGSLLDPGPGPNGSVRRIPMDSQGNPGPVEVIRDGLAFPDGVALFPGNLQPGEWRSYAGGPLRQFSNPAETAITPQNAAQLDVRWRFPTGAIITGSPSVAAVPVPGEGLIQVVYFQSWDGNVYAVRLADGSELWRFESAYQPGASYPNAASVHVERVDGADRVYVGAGETFYALDAASGSELWRFTAGTGCAPAPGAPFGLCGQAGERNQIESSAIVAEGLVFFGMDVNDVATGKGGFYGLDARDGRMVFFFDLESGMTCRPFESDAIRAYDGYHSEAELGLPAGFLATRPGCDHPRTRTGCSNVWSSPAYDAARELLYFASSNCDTDDDPGTSTPPPPMPPHDEAVTALRTDGTPAWRWRPREVDNGDLAFGAAPNLFSIRRGEATIEVLGIGNKDGRYTVLDRDGVNEESGVAWDDPNANTDLPYWRTRVVAGGSLGGVLATSAVDEAARRVYFATAPGGSSNIPPAAPQRPTVHALDLDTGAVVWQNDEFVDALRGDANFAPSSAIPGVLFTGTVLTPSLRLWRTDDDSGAFLGYRQVNDQFFGSAVASGAVVVDGTVLVGAGIGERAEVPDPDPQSADATSRIPSDLVALCVPGTRGCAACNDGDDDDADGLVDFPADPECESAADPSELAACEDGLDNDHDGAADHPADPGCRNRLARSRENPPCQDGVDNDGDGATDHPADPQCTTAWGESEGSPPPSGPSCGLLGIEPLLAAGLAAALARVRRRGARRAERTRALAALVAATGLLAAGFGPVGRAAAEPLPIFADLEVRLVDQLLFSVGPRQGVADLDVDQGTLALPAGLLSVDGLVIPAGSLLGAATQLTLTAQNAAGTFAIGGALAGRCPGPLAGRGACVYGRGFGGALALSGALQVAPLGLQVPLGVVGGGGIATAGGGALRLQGAPWTTGTAAISTTGPSAALYTAMGQAGQAPAPALQLVTPVYIAGELPGQPLPVFLRLTVRPIPEPGTLWLLSAGLVALGLGVRRRSR